MPAVEGAGDGGGVHAAGTKIITAAANRLSAFLSRRTLQSREIEPRGGASTAALGRDSPASSSENEPGETGDYERTGTTLPQDIPPSFREAYNMASAAAAVATGPATKPNVRFSVVQVKRYSLTLGDHPAVDHFPLSLDWAHASLEQFDVSEYEDQRCDDDGTLIPYLNLFERCQRIAEVTGITPSELAAQDQARHAALLAACCEYHDFEDEDEDLSYTDEDFCDSQESSESSSSCLSCTSNDGMGRIDTAGILCMATGSLSDQPQEDSAMVFSSRIAAPPARLFPVAGSSDAHDAKDKSARIQQQGNDSTKEKDVDIVTGDQSQIFRATGSWATSTASRKIAAKSA